VSADIHPASPQENSALRLPGFEYACIPWDEMRGVLVTEIPICPDEPMPLTPDLVSRAIEDAHYRIHAFYLCLAAVVSPECGSGGRCLREDRSYQEGKECGGPSRLRALAAAGPRWLATLHLSA